MTLRSHIASTCPELEDLAAFVDGRLNGEELSAVAAHLGECDDCYEVYVETLHVQEDLGMDLEAVPENPAEVVEFPLTERPPARRRGGKLPDRRVTAALAAVVLAALGALWLGRGLLLESGPPVVGYQDVSAMPVFPFATTEWYVHRWPTRRGPENLPLGPQEIALLKRAFRIGVHSVDILAALEMGDRDLAERFTFRLISVLGGIDFSQHYVILYEEIRDDLPEADVASIRKQLKEADELLREGDLSIVDPFYFFFGKWTEMSRLAAMTEARQYFSGRRFKRGFRYLLKRQHSEGVSEQLDTVESLLLAPRADFEGLERAFAEIIRLEGVRSR